MDLTEIGSMRRLVPKNQDLHGNVPDNCSVALLLLDVLNDLDFPGNSALVKAAPLLAANISSLKSNCKHAGIPTIYVNDNHGKWRSDLQAVLSNCLRPGSLGRHMVEKIVPEPSDYVVLKPKHSIFYATPLETLLSYLKTKTVILTGLTTNACVLTSAGEIFVRDLKLYVPSDCVAAQDKRDHRNALQLMKKSFKADITLSTRLNLRKLLR